MTMGVGWGGGWEVSSPAWRASWEQGHCLSGGCVSTHAVTLPHKGAQLPLPIAIRVLIRMPTADSFVGMPFMRPTLRMHSLSTLQRHTITGDSQGWKRRVEGKSSPVAQSPKPGPTGWYVCMCTFMHMYVFVCGEGCNAPQCVCLHKHESVCPAKNVQVCTGICCP